MCALQEQVNQKEVLKSNHMSKMIHVHDDFFSIGLKIFQY